MKPQVSAINQIHDEIQILSILEGVKRIDKELILEALQEIELVHDWLDAFFKQDSKYDGRYLALDISFSA